MAEQDDDKVTSPSEALAETVDAVLTAELAVLQAEMEVLKHLIPGVPRPDGGSPPTDDAEIESNFDNMPV